MDIFSLVLPRIEQYQLQSITKRLAFRRNFLQICVFANANILGERATCERQSVASGVQTTSALHCAQIDYLHLHRIHPLATSKHAQIGPFPQTSSARKVELSLPKGALRELSGMYQHMPTKSLQPNGAAHALREFGLGEQGSGVQALNRPIPFVRQ